MKFEIPRSVVSPQDYASLVQEIKQYAAWHTHETIKSKVGKGTPSEQPPLSTAASELLGTWSNGAAVTAKDFDTLIAYLTTYGEKAPRIAITLAAPPSRAVQTELAEWCRKNLAPNLLVSFGFSEAMCGGMVVRFGSRVFDWSFRKAIIENKANLAGALRHV